MKSIKRSILGVVICAALALLAAPAAYAQPDDQTAKASSSAAAARKCKPVIKLTDNGLQTRYRVGKITTSKVGCSKARRTLHSALLRSKFGRRCVVKSCKVRKMFCVVSSRSRGYLDMECGKDNGARIRGLASWDIY